MGLNVAGDVDADDDDAGEDDDGMVGSGANSSVLKSLVLREIVTNGLPCWLGGLLGGTSSMSSSWPYSW